MITGDEYTTILTEELKVLFDMCTSGIDFGSGNLETEEVELLRRLAVQFGVDPMEATPHTYSLQYTHEYKPEGNTVIREDKSTYTRYWCKHCYQDKGHKIHKIG